MTLKTLKDFKHGEFEANGWAFALRQEVIKLVKEKRRERQERIIAGLGDLVNFETYARLSGLIDGFMTFFNIIEEDLK